MSHIDTLKVYEEYRATGLDEKSARQFTNILENSFMTKVKEFKEDFANQKMVSIMGGVIITMLLAMGGELWYVSKEVSILSRDTQEIRLLIKSE